MKKVINFSKNKHHSNPVHRQHVRAMRFSKYHGHAEHRLQVKACGKMKRTELMREFGFCYGTISRQSKKMGQILCARCLSQVVPSSSAPMSQK